jgi:hypothetical protein
MHLKENKRLNEARHQGEAKLGFKASRRMETTEVYKRGRKAMRTSLAHSFVLFLPTFRFPSI